MCLGMTSQVSPRQPLLPSADVACQFVDGYVSDLCWCCVPLGLHRHTLHRTDTSDT